MNKNKIVAISINTTWNIFNFRLGLIKALQKEGYEVIAIAPKDTYVQPLEAMGVACHHIEMNNKGTNPIEELKLIYGYFRVYKRVQPDVILSYTIKPNIYGSMAAGMLGIPVISNISGLGTVFLNNNISSKIARFLYKIALKVPKKVFFQNPYDKELFVDSGLVNAKKTDLLPGSGIDTEKFKPLDSECVYGNECMEEETDKKVKFLFIARLVKDKGLIEYVDAARNVRLSVNHNSLGVKLSTEFAILGAYYPDNPTAISEDEMQVWENEGVVTYLGTSDNVKSIISEYDCIVLPSYREGLSRVLLEAASMAKPIITTNVPGCKDVVDDGVSGYLCKVKDAVSLAEQMKKMVLLSKEEQIAMGNKGREKVINEFDEKLVIEKYKEAITSLCSIR